MSENDLDKLFSEFEETEKVEEKREEAKPSEKPTEVERIIKEILSTRPDLTEDSLRKMIQAKREEITILTEEGAVTMLYADLLKEKKAETAKPQEAKPKEEPVEAFAELLGEEEEVEERVEERVVTKSEPEPIKEGEFDTSDDAPTIKRSYMIYGEKGEGKTGLAFSFPGKIYCLSFDKKSVDVWANMYGKTDRIKVKDGVRYLAKMSPEMWLKSADVSFRYVNHLLETDGKNFQPDWIVIDGLEILVRDVCEKRMRYMNNVSPFGGVQLTLWQERNMYVDQLHKVSTDIATQGVVYTAYVREKTVTIKDGEVKEQTREPAWAADVKYYADVVILVEAENSDKGRDFYANVQSSKTNEIKTGVRVLTGRSFMPTEDNIHGYDRILKASRT